MAAENPKSFEEYLAEELKYYEDHPEDDDPVECHSNALMGSECEYKWHLEKWHSVSGIGMRLPYNKDMRNIQLTEDQETAIADALVMLMDLGVPDHINEADFDSACDIIFNPTPFDYSWVH